MLNNDTLITHQTTGRADLSGVFPRWEPVGNCGPDDPPSEDCSGFGRIRNEDDYQRPRSWLLTLGFQF